MGAILRISGHTQAIDSAPVKAIASMDSLELKVPAEDLEEHLSRLRAKAAGTEKPKRTKPLKNNRE